MSFFNLKRTPANPGHKGSVLLFVLGILALLSLLASAMFFITQREENAAREYINKTRAQFAAESGVETAIAKLLSYQGAIRNVPQWMAPFPTDEYYPLKHLTQSSFGSLDLDGDGLMETAGTISETYTPNGDRFKLRLQSAHSKLNINDTNSPLNIDSDPFEDQWTPDRIYLDIPVHLRNPTVPGDPTLDKDPDWAYPGDLEFDEAKSIGNKPHAKAPGRLENIIAHLLSILFPYDSTQAQSGDNQPLSFWQEASKKLFDVRRARPSDAFDTFAEIKAVLVPDYMNFEQYNQFEALLALHSWQDKNVILPTFQWRINTPPILDLDKPDLPPTQHLSDYPGDFPTGVEPLFTSEIPPRPYFGKPCPRPGHLNPGIRGQDMLGAVEFDFNNDGTISASEKVHHDHDLYIFSDMQTRYFAMDPRCPLDVNDTPLPLLQALIEPVQGWYLQEAPSTWRGEDIRSRAEDWSQSVCDGYHLNYQFPWFMMDTFDVTIENTGSRLWHAWLSGWPDESQYYYYDSYAKSYLRTKDGWWWLAGDPYLPTDPPIHHYQAAEKSARFGELKLSQALTDCIQSSSSTTIAQTLAQELYDRIHNTDLTGDGNPDFNPFQTWEEFEEFILDLADLGFGDGNHLTGDLRDFDIYMAHAVIANFNPNSKLNDFNPDKRGFLYVDKSQLSGYSTEFCFHTLGEVKIESLGQVFDNKDKEVASSSIRCQMGAWECLRFSTQEQFMRGYNGTRAGAAKMLGQSDGENPTAGAETTNGNLSSGAFPGYMTQSYPEPELNLGDYISNSRYDGCLRLATVQTEQKEFFALGSSQEENNGFVANFRGTLDADHAGGSRSLQIDDANSFWMVDHWRFRLGDRNETIPRDSYPPSFGGWLGNTWLDFLPDLTAQVPANKPGYRPLCKPLSDIHSGNLLLDTPGHLHPDGVLSDTGRTPKYEMPDNFGDSSMEAGPLGSDWDEWVSGRRGSVQFWVKPNFDVSHSNRVRNLFCAPPRAGNWDIPEAYPWPNLYFSDTAKDLSLYYFSRGGRRVVANPGTGRLDDDFHISYHPHIDFHDGRWLPTRSLMFVNGEWLTTYMTNFWPAFGGRFLSGYNPGIGTSSVNQSWREAEDIPSPGNWEFNLESHQWSNIALSWNWIGDFAGVGMGYNGCNYVPPDRFFYMSINGKGVESIWEQKPECQDNIPPLYLNYTRNESFQNYWGYFWTTVYPLSSWIHWTDWGLPNYFRFGESSSGWWRNNVADSTYDDFVSSKKQHLDSNLENEFDYGRYYASDDVTYTSPEFDPFQEMAVVEDKLRLVNISWTAYWPLPANNMVAANHPRFNDNLNPGSNSAYIPVEGKQPTSRNYAPNNQPDPMAAKWGVDFAPFSIDIHDPITNQWYYENRSYDKMDMPNSSEGSYDPQWLAGDLIWQKSKNHKLQFRVHFNIKPGQTLYASPIFEDITFIFSPGRIKIINWEQD